MILIQLVGVKVIEKHFTFNKDLKGNLFLVNIPKIIIIKFIKAQNEC